MPTALQEQVAALEAANMAAFERNGESFAAYFKRWDLMIHTAKAADGTHCWASPSAARRGAASYSSTSCTSPRRTMAAALRLRCGTSLKATGEMASLAHTLREGLVSSCLAHRRPDEAC